MNARKVSVAMGLVIFGLQSAFGSDGAPPRIGSIFFDNGKVQKLFLYPGRTALLDFPCEITRAAGGPAGDIEWVIGSTDKTEMDVWLKSGASQPTNLTVRCNHEVFVFDVIPSRTTHQEYLEIVGNYGGASLNGATQISSSKTDEYPEKKLVATSHTVTQSPKKKPRADQKEARR